MISFLHFSPSQKHISSAKTTILKAYNDGIDNDFNDKIQQMAKLKVMHREKILIISQKRTNKYFLLFYTNTYVD